MARTLRSAPTSSTNSVKNQKQKSTKMNNRNVKQTKLQNVKCDDWPKVVEVVKRNDFQVCSIHHESEKIEEFWLSENYDYDCFIFKKRRDGSRNLIKTVAHTSPCIEIQKMLITTLTDSPRPLDKLKLDADSWLTEFSRLHAVRSCQLVELTFDPRTRPKPQFLDNLNNQATLILKISDIGNMGPNFFFSSYFSRFEESVCVVQQQTENNGLFNDIAFRRNETKRLWVTGCAMTSKAIQEKLFNWQLGITSLEFFMFRDNSSAFSLQEIVDGLNSERTLFIGDENYETHLIKREDGQIGKLHFSTRCISFNGTDQELECPGE